MEKKSISDNSIKFANLVNSWHPVKRNGWWIKFSTHYDSVLLIFVSQYTTQTIIRYFDDENLAVDFINFIINVDPALEYNEKDLPE
jgi:hypothetical protein